MIVRQITEQDFGGYYDCLDSVARERKYLAMYEAPDREGSLGWVRSNISKNHPMHVLLDGGSVVGWCDITPHYRDVFSHRGELGMGLRKDYRGKGHGKTLAASAIAHARKIGLRRIELDVRADNVTAIRLYQRLGFEEEGRIRQGIKREDEGFEDVILMALFTGAPTSPAVVRES